MSARLRIGIFGVGAIGGLVAGRRASTDAELILFSRGDSAAAMAIDGVRITGLEAEVNHFPASRFEVVDSDSPATSEGIDPISYAIVCGKAPDTSSLALLADLHLESTGMAISLQNGLGHAERLGEMLGSARVLSGSTLHGATRLGPNEVRWAGRGVVDIGPHPNHRSDDGTPSASSPEGRLLSAFEQAGLDPIWHGDMRQVLWRKLLLNVAINPIAAICGVENGALLASRELHEQAHGVLIEALLVARSEGVELDADEMLSKLDEVIASTAGNRCSMLQDVMAGRRTEIDALCGEIVRRGESHGIPTPRNQLLLILVRSLSGNAE